MLLLPISIPKIVMLKIFITKQKNISNYNASNTISIANANNNNNNNKTNSNSNLLHLLLFTQLLKKVHVSGCKNGFLVVVLVVVCVCYINRKYRFLSFTR